MSTGFLVCSLTNGGWAPLGGQKMEGKRGNHISFPDSISSIGLGWQHLFIKDSAVIKQLSKQLPILGTSNSFLSCSGRPDVAKYLYCLVDAVQRLICFPWIPLQQRTRCPLCWSTVTQNKQLWRAILAPELLMWSAEVAPEPVPQLDVYLYCTLLSPFFSTGVDPGPEGIAKLSLKICFPENPTYKTRRGHYLLLVSINLSHTSGSSQWSSLKGPSVATRQMSVIAL